MGLFTTAARTWGSTEVVTSTNLNAQLRDFINGFGAWTSYTPTLTGWTLGSGTIAGAYTQVGKMVWFRASLTLNATTVSGAPIFSLPVTAVAAMAGSSFTAGLTGGFVDTGTAAYTAHCRWESATTVGLYIPGTNGIRTAPSTTTPFTWANNDTVNVAGFYEAA